MAEKLSREELYGSIYDYIQYNHLEIEALTEKCFSLPTDSLDFLKISIRLSGLMSTNMWLTQNSDCETLNELEERIHQFESIINDNRFSAIEKNMELSCFANLYIQYPDVYVKRYSSCLEENDLSLDSNAYDVERRSFIKGLSLIDEYLNDTDVQEKEEKCHFNLYGLAKREDWTGLDYYKINETNRICLSHLKSFLRNLKNNSYGSKNK